jgi:hypothetical protein
LRQDGTVRPGTTRVGAAGLLAALGALLLGSPAAADPAALGTVIVDPAHGPATAAVNASYRAPSFQGRCLRATFAWDGRFVGSAEGSIATDKACRYALSFLPPPLDRAPGTHTVSATTGTVGSAGATSYRIDLAASRSPDPSPSAKSSPTASPKPSRTRTTPTVAASTDYALPAPATTDQSGAVGPAAPNSATHVAAPASSWTAWAMVGGGALVLGGVLVIGWLLIQNRRAARADDLSDAATVEQPRLGGA